MIEVLDQGYHITIQDSGRKGFSKYGVTSSGSMDLISANNANSILSNSLDEAVFEGNNLFFDIHMCIFFITAIRRWGWCGHLLREWSAA